MAHSPVKTLLMVALTGTILSGCSIFGSKSSKETSATSAVTEVSTSKSGTTTTTKTVEIIETVNLGGNHSYDIITVDRASFLLLNAEASLQDWRSCEVSSNGYWNFDEFNTVGTLNPKFESCMLGMGYRLETNLSDHMLALLNDYSVTQLASAKTSSETTIETSHKMVDSQHNMMTMTETVVEVENATVMGDTTTIQPITTTVKRSGDILETVRLSANKSYDIVTVDGALIIRLNGEASMQEWRNCEVRTNGYWQFDGTNTLGSLKPEFANCMQGLDYTLETVSNDEAPAVFLSELDEPIEIVETAELSMDVPEASDVTVKVQPQP